MCHRCENLSLNGELQCRLLVLNWRLLQDGVTPVASLATFGAYVAIHGGAALTPSLAFTILALFSILVRLFSIAPLGKVHH
jgi:hypothetical protein